MASISGQQSPLKWQDMLQEQRLVAPRWISQYPKPVGSLQHDVMPTSLHVLGSIKDRN